MAAITQGAAEQEIIPAIIPQGAAACTKTYITIMSTIGELVKGLNKLNLLDRFSDGPGYRRRYNKKGQVFKFDHYYTNKSDEEWVRSNDIPFFTPDSIRKTVTREYPSNSLCLEILSKEILLYIFLRDCSYIPRMYYTESCSFSLSDEIIGHFQDFKRKMRGKCWCNECTARNKTPELRTLINLYMATLIEKIVDAYIPEEVAPVNVATNEVAPVNVA
jgi:hypothetical protein